MAAWFDCRTRPGGHTFCDWALPVAWSRTPYIDISHLLVLFHMDLHMRNFILDANIAKGKLWANAGRFPPVAGVSREEEV
jgi:hypothetical protein